LDWITCLRAATHSRKSANPGLGARPSAAAASLFDESDLAEISSPNFPGERLIVCRNRDPAAERAQARGASGRSAGAARAERSSPVVAIDPSAAVKAKKATKRNAHGDPINSFAGLVDHLGTMTRNTMRMPLAAAHPITFLSKSTPLQEATFKLLGLEGQDKTSDAGVNSSWSWREMLQPASPATTPTTTIDGIAPLRMHHRCHTSLTAVSLRR
jgi:hypothetical protein